MSVCGESNANKLTDLGQSIDFSQFHYFFSARSLGRTKQIPLYKLNLRYSHATCAHIRYVAQYMLAEIVPSWCRRCQRKQRPWARKKRKREKIAETTTIEYTHKYWCKSYRSFVSTTTMPSINGEIVSRFFSFLARLFVDSRPCILLFWLPRYVCCVLCVCILSRIVSTRTSQS